ncbi:unnamed protein product [Parnassius mnemosyne]|uniref:CCHC-type domain-containing protein n=1 Tax=Parnassius mnemosyne TaxID=213953 RepID=A0AAV1LT11_9NEOP
MDLIEYLIKQGKKSWIQEKTKEELIEIANILAKETKFLDTHTIKDVRKYLREYVDKQKEKIRTVRLITSPSSISTMNSITTLEVFTGENWNAYQQQFECFIVLNDIPEEKKVPLLITKLSTNVYDLLTTLCTPISPVTETYNNICEKLRKYYHPLKNYALYQAEFRSRCQKPNETIDQYIMELKRLSKYCNFKNLNEEIKERLLNGTYCDSVKFELLKQADQPLESLINIGKTVETAYKLVFNNEKEQEKSQMFKIQGKYFNRNHSVIARQNVNPAIQQSITCFCCGKNGHIKAHCTLREKFCSECGVKGHIFKVCRKNKKIKVKNLNVVQKFNSENSDVNSDNNLPIKHIENFDIFCFSNTGKVPSTTLKILVNGKVLEFEVDTGADVSTITLLDKNKLFPELEIKKCNVLFTNFDQSTSTPLGVIENLSISYESTKVNNQKLFVVKDGLPKVIGKDWLSSLQLWPPKFEQRVCEKASKNKLIQNIFEKFSNLFEPGMGVFRGEPIHLLIEPGVKPVFMPVRTVPFALKDKCELSFPP